MPKTITVKGIGRVVVSPDWVVLSMTLESCNMNYEEAMDTAAKGIEQINVALKSVGFEMNSVKTTDFKVRADYEYQRKRNGDQERVFAGYVVKHDLKLEFDLDTGRLARVLSAVGNCAARPQLSILFTVKDETAINEGILQAAAANAKRKAEVLCNAAGKELGELISINYNWEELSIFSNTRLELAEEEHAPVGMAFTGITPDDIDVSDTATFVWEMK